MKKLLSYAILSTLLVQNSFAGCEEAFNLKEEQLKKKTIYAEIAALTPTGGIFYSLITKGAIASGLGGAALGAMAVGITYVAVTETKIKNMEKMKAIINGDESKLEILSRDLSISLDKDVSIAEIKPIVSKINEADGFCPDGKAVSWKDFKKLVEINLTKELPSQQ
ncbi:MAG: hypothetical protein AB7I27_05100 [Bacteriovoracaceae bacterium]